MHPSLHALAILALAVALALAATTRHAPRDSTHAGPTLLVPVRRESVSTESEPAPLLIPGRGSPGDTAIRSREQRAREEYALGRSFEKNGEPASAISAYRNAVMFDPTLPDAHYRIGRLFIGVGQFGEAAKAFAQEVTHHPENSDAARELGLALASSGESDRAITQLELLTQHRPQDGAAWSALGFAYLAARRPHDAETALRRAIELPPALAREHRDLAVILSSRGRTREARDEYRLALDLDPHDATVWVNLANLERRAKHLDKALEGYRSAEHIDSTVVLALDGQAQVLRQLGRNLEAGEVYRRWLARTPENADIRLEAVKLFDALGRKDVALELARDGVRNQDYSGTAHVVLGMALHSAGESRAALAELHKAHALFRAPADRDRVRKLVAAMRATAPDSLRPLFEADSLAHSRPKR